MASTFLKTAERELSVLEAKLAGNADFARWRAVKSTIEAYQASALPPAAPDHALANRATVGTSYAVPVTASKAPAIIEAAVKYLREQNRRVNSTVMAEALVKRGVELSGKSIAATLSAYLSAAKNEIDNVRGEGYGLREWSLNRSESETPDSGKLSGVSSNHREVVN